MKNFTILVLFLTTFCFSQSRTHNADNSNTISAAASKDYEARFNRAFDKPTRSFNRKNRIQDNSNRCEYRLDSLTNIIFNEDALTLKRKTKYDVNGNQTLYIIYFWNSATQSFELSSKNEYQYDPNENLILYIGYSWDNATQSFQQSSKIEYQYDTNGNLTLHTSYFWDSATKSFKLSRKREYHFDANGNQILEINYDWDSAAQSFELHSKYEYQYNADGNLTLLIGYFWDTAKESFEPSIKYENQYNANGNPTLYIIYFWDSATQSYEPNYKSDYQYDANGNRTLRIDYDFNNTTGYFVPDHKYEYKYDSDQIVPDYDRTLKTVYKWYPNLGIYKPSFKKEYENIEDNQGDVIRKGITSEYDTDFNKWEVLEEEQYQSYWYFTKEQSLSIEDVEKVDFSVYPNPTKSLIHINTKASLDGAKLELYDLQGRKVIYKFIQRSNPINIQDLSPALYFYNIKNGHKIIKSGKIIKQ